MRKLTTIYLSIGLALQMSGPAHADPTMECGVSNGSQVEIGNCINAVQGDVDKTVELTLGFAMDAAKELDEVTGRDNSVKALSASQQAWSTYRDAQCDYVGSTFGGGSGTGIAITSCRVDLGRQRVSELMGHLN